MHTICTLAFFCCMLHTAREHLLANARTVLYTRCTANLVYSLVLRLNFDMVIHQLCVANQCMRTFFFLETIPHLCFEARESLGFF
uniref:Secreted protein n=1 Tax=Anopheles quadriannulatus TaxID=34691 RepID=A0A182XQR1_ANOQN